MEHIGFFEEASEEYSITRVAFAAMVAAALFIAVFEVFTTGNFNIVEFTTMAGTACGLKLFQKSQEIKQNQNN